MHLCGAAVCLGGETGLERLSGRPDECRWIPFLCYVGILS